MARFKANRNRNYGNNNPSTSNNNNRGGSGWVDGRLLAFNSEDFTDILSDGFSIRNVKRYDFDKKNEDAKEDKPVREKVTKNAEQRETLQAFVDDITDNKTDSSALKDIITNQFIGVCEIMVNYYENKFNNIVDVMNAVIKVMTTNRFTETLLSVISDDYNMENWDIYKRTIAKTISIILQTSSDKISENAQNNYIEMITEYIYPGEIAELVNGTGIYEDAVIDLFITIPEFGNKMNMADINATYANFAATIIRYYDELSAYADKDFLKDLFYKIFPDIDGQAAKVVGKCLSSVDPDFNATQEQLDVMIPLFDEYVKMLYEVLNDNEISDIQNTLIYIATTLEKSGKTMDDIIFDVEDAWEYPNIRKAYFQVSRTNAKCEKYFR